MKIGGQRIPGKTLVLILSEGALIGCGLLFATALRFFSLDELRQQLREPGTLVRYGLVIVVCELALYYFDLYDLSVVRRPTILFARLLQALGAACLILAVVYFVDPELGLGRGVAVIAAPIIITFVISWRLLVDAGLPFFRRRQRVLIMGSGSAGNALAQEIVSRPELNIEIVGFLHEEEDARNRSFGSAEPKSPREYDRRTPQLGNVYTFRAADKPASVPEGGFPPLKLAAVAGIGVNSTAVAPALDEPQPHSVNQEMPPVIGTVADVQRLALEKEADLIVLSLSERRGQMPLKELLNLKFLGIQVEEAHNTYERVAGRIILDQLSPSWLILSDGFRKSQPLLAAKRISDMVISVILLVIMAPVAALVAFAILLESGRPLLFRQGRVGLNGKTFQIIKFRSMWQQLTPPANQTWTADGDTRITRVGRFIRKFRLDEIPQLINVLLGDMSLVGPRPEQPELARTLEQEIPYYDQRHSLRPGITGWAQVKCGYGATIQQSRIKLEHDLFYIKHLSVMLDSIILFETAKVLLSGRGAK
jgi:lipopolysaccharide/colanic/teichoic acid biosynthesis glycosyltransferase